MNNTKRKSRRKNRQDFRFGGDKGDRTPDLLTASQALSQLSYTPEQMLFVSTRYILTHLF